MVLRRDSEGVLLTLLLSVFLEWNRIENTC